MISHQYVIYLPTVLSRIAYKSEAHLDTSIGDGPRATVNGLLH